MRSRLAELEGLDVTVIHGSEDALVASAAAASSPRRSRARGCAEIDECGHLLLTDAEDDVMAAIDEHLRRAGARGRRSKWQANAPIRVAGGRGLATCWRKSPANKPIILFLESRTATNRSATRVQCP